jgi:hypothetical protein
MSKTSRKPGDDNEAGGSEPLLNPQPLIPHQREAAPYPVEALGPLKAVVEAVAEITGAPIEASAQTALAVAAFSARDLCTVKNLSGGVSPLILNFMTIGTVGPRQHNADQMLTRGVIAWSSELQRDHEAASEKLERTRKSWDREHKRLVAKKDLSREDFERQLEALGRRPTCPPSAFSDGVSSLLSYGADVPFVSRALTRPGQREKTSRDLCAAFDGIPGTPSLHRSEKQPLFVRVPPVEAKVILTDPLNREAGLLHRILPLRVRPSLLRCGQPSQGAESEIDAFKKDIHDLLKRSSSNECPRVLAVSPEALELSRAWAAEIEMQSAIGEDFEAIPQMVERGPEFAHRLGALLAIFADPAAATTEITVEVMKHATTLTGFYLEEAAQLFDESGIDDELRIAQRLLDWLQGLDHSTVDLSAIYQKAPRPIRNKATALKFLHILQSYGQVLDLGGGKWRIAPKEPR